MAIHFSSFSHWSSESNLPEFSITGGNEVINQWRSPYDPTLWYLHNISSEGDRPTTRTTQTPYGKKITVDPSSTTIASGGSGPAVEGYDQGVRYDGFLRSGDYNTYKFTRDVSGLSGYYTPSTTNPLIKGGSGSSSSPRTDISTFYEELPRKNNSGIGNGVGPDDTVDRYTWGYGGDTNWSGDLIYGGTAPDRYGTTSTEAWYSNSHVKKHLYSQGGNWQQSATSKVLKYGRLFYQYDGGQATNTSTKGAYAGFYGRFDLNLMVWRENQLSYNNGQWEDAYYQSQNYPEIWMQDARFKWSDKKSILRESEVDILDPSPVKKFNNAARGWTVWPSTKPDAADVASNVWNTGHKIGITTHQYGLESIEDSMHWYPGYYDHSTPSSTGYGGTWTNPSGYSTGIRMGSYAWLYGTASDDYWNDGGLGHCQVWGRNFCVGNGMMFFGKYGSTYSHSNEGTFSSIDGGHDAIGWGIIPYHAEQDGKGQGPDQERVSDPDETFYKPDGYLPTDLHPWHVMDYDKWFQYDPEHLPSLSDARDGDGGGQATDKWMIRIVDMAKGCRMKTTIGAFDVDVKIELFGVGNGRIYTTRSCYDGVTGADNYDFLYMNHGVRPYPVGLNGFNRGASRRSMEIMDMSGITRKCHFSPNGGVQFNYGNISSGTGMYGNPPVDSFEYFISAITAGCGRVAVSAPYYRHRYDDMPSSAEEYGVVWLFTQDGQFIKTLSFRDESWSTTGNAQGFEIRYGDKIAIKNNLIFVLASDFDMSFQYQNYFKDTNYTTSEAGYYTWGGKGRMYIYSLDGELLAAFSPYNLGFKNTEDYSKLFSFDDFLTDGVNLYMFDNCTKKLGNLNDHYVAGTLGVAESNETADAGYSISATPISKNTQVMHLKLPESITKYYDEISEMYRY